MEESSKIDVSKGLLILEAQNGAHQSAGLGYTRAQVIIILSIFIQSIANNLINNQVESIVEALIPIQIDAFKLGDEYIRKYFADTLRLQFIFDQLEIFWDFNINNLFKLFKNRNFT